MELPTIEQCHQFMATINAGRKAVGLEPIETLDYDGATPGHTHNCLSARHLFNAIPGVLSAVRTNAVNLDRDPDMDVDRDLAAALAIKHLRTLFGSQGLSSVLIPPEILAVTDVFDACDSSQDTAPALHSALRDRLAEAGLIKNAS